MMALTIPANLSGFVTGNYGAPAAEWLRLLPELVAACADRWCLTLGEPFAGLTHSYAAPAVRRDGRHTVLKVGYPTERIENEIAALTALGRRGIVQLLDADRDRGALLLERAMPGTPLVAGSSEEIETACQVLRQLWRPVRPDTRLMTIPEKYWYWEEHICGLHREAQERNLHGPAAVLDQAKALLVDLVRLSKPIVTLHGAFTHPHILASERESWLAIDPIGLIGDPAFDVGTFLSRFITPALPVRDRKAFMGRRIDQMAEALELDRERIRAWYLVQATIVSRHLFKIGESPEPWSEDAAILAEM